MTHYDHEEEFHSRDRKQFRKERKLSQKLDRSKFKKTDLPQKDASPPPDLSHLLKGRVIAISGEGAWVHDGESTILCSIKGLMKKEKGQVKNILAVGDWVFFSKEGAIEYIEPRTSILARTDISGRKEQLIAVNVDQVIIVVSIVSPPLKPALVDRYLIAAEKGGIHPIIVLNKIDLLDQASGEEQERYRQFLAAYEPLGWPILSLSTQTQVGIPALRSLLQNKTSVFSGQSGVGKSSLLNICFDMQQKVGGLAAKTQKGSHTTTKAELLTLPLGGYCVDTPGIRSFGIWGLLKADVIAHFHDFAVYQPSCRYPDCTHIDEPDCAVQTALQEGKIAPLRYESYVHLLNEIASGAQITTWS